MPSHLHEVLAELARHRPEMLADLLSGPLKLELPAWDQVRVESNELTQIRPTQYDADVVVVFTAANQPVLAVIHEVQLRRDLRKRRTWPHYLTSVHARLGCSTMLLVVCADDVTAAWCASPIPLGHPDFVLNPLVIGPGQVPVVTDPSQAERVPELAVLSAMSHGSGPEQEQVFRAMLRGLQTIDQEHAGMYTDALLAVLPAAARHCLEALMDVATYEFQSDYFRRRLAEARAEIEAEGWAGGRAQGMAQGEAEALLAVLGARGIEVPDDARERITSCTDLRQLKIWIQRSVTIDSINSLFD